MGIGATSLKFLVYCKRNFDINFTRTATLGRLQFAKTFSSARLLKKHVLEPALNLDEIFVDGFCEGVLKHMGAGLVESFDYSDYECATHIVDMNEPIDDSHKGKYTLLIDGGTSEHIFHVPNVYKNMMDMVEVGGHIICYVPTNNWCGHGFYQFSPELYFNLFAKERGFEIKTVAYGVGTSAGAGVKKLWEIPNPNETRKVVMLYTRRETMLFVCARKVSDSMEYPSPQQSMWEIEAWNADGKPGLLKRLKKNRFLNAVLPACFKQFAVKLASRQRLKELKL